MFPALEHIKSLVSIYYPFCRTVSMYLIPRENIARVGAWVAILIRIMASPIDFLSEYFHMNVCESGFSSDKGRFCRVVRQRRIDRQETALFSNVFLHNLYAIRVNPK